MPLRLSIPKLAAAAVPALQTAPKFRSELLKTKGTWPQDVNYLRDTYGKVYALWTTHETKPGVAYDPADDKRLFDGTEPLLRELVLGMEGVAKQRGGRLDIFKSSENALHDFETASTYGRTGDYATATVYQSYALMKLHRLLDSLTAEANRKQGSRKVGYGYDTSGEQGTGGGTGGDGKDIRDTGNSPKLDRTPANPANMLIDADAESDYPELAAFKHKRVYWPPRTR
jgi:hypothetical protein